MKILILQGPGMRLLGANLLASCDAPQLETRLRQEARVLGVELEFFQSNSESALLDFIEARQGDFDRVLLFPTTLAQNGLALHQHMRLLSLPAIEVHFDPEQAKDSILKPLCFNQVMGLKGAIEGLHQLMRIQRDDLSLTRRDKDSPSASALPRKTLGRKKTMTSSVGTSPTGTPGTRKTLGRK